jgi:predicted aspartyl protease
MGRLYEVSLSWAESRRVRALVDTGSIFIVLPPELAAEIGMALSPRKVKVRLASGAEVEAEPGTVIVDIDGREAPATAIILEGAEPLRVLRPSRPSASRSIPRPGSLNRPGPTQPSGLAGR